MIVMVNSCQPVLLVVLILLMMIKTIITRFYYKEKKMKTHKTLMIGLALAMSLTPVAFGGDHAGNPCGGKAMHATHAMNSERGVIFDVNDPMHRNSVTFKSSAPLEDIVGTSNDVTGYLSFDPENPMNGGHGELTVPVSSLGTGIPLRDEHLAGVDWLNADQNPNITFKISEVNNVKQVKSTADAKTFDVIAVGDFSLNGITRQFSTPARITYLKESESTKMRLPGNLLAARTNFYITLADFSITGPEGMNLVGSKVGESIEIDLSLVASSATNGNLAAKLSSK